MTKISNEGATAREGTVRYLRHSTWTLKQSLYKLGSLQPSATGLNFLGDGQVTKWPNYVLGSQSSLDLKDPERVHPAPNKFPIFQNTVDLADKFVFVKAELTMNVTLTNTRNLKLLTDYSVVGVFSKKLEHSIGWQGRLEQVVIP